MNTLLKNVVTQVWGVSMQEVPVAAHDLQQIEEAITLAAAPRPAALVSYPCLMTAVLCNSKLSL